MAKLASLIALCVFTFSVQARDQIKIVGSSTVYPFASFVAEEFGSVSRYPTPVVESTGTGGGMKLFCTDNSLDSPDITNASRRIKIKELHLCERNGVSNITEVMFGYDGIVLAQSKANKPFNVSKKDMLLALAKKVPNKEGTALIDNPYTNWNQINPALPDRKITVYGPPISSGTRDAFEEIVLQYQTEEMKVYRDAGLKGYRVIRSDGVYIPSGENDNLIVKQLTKDKLALGIFGYSFLTENEDTIAGVDIDNVSPSSESIASKDYPISRSLFFYVKNDHIEKVPAIKEYIEMFLNVDIIGEDGLLTEIGLIPMGEEEIDHSLSEALEQKQLELDVLEDALHVSQR
ncbi:MULTISPECIES: substrate-binding domain-containing protein [unclassified Oleiphilus]|uniref:substrate-binding domain-containing protein n=1 Tax=unclassified Oleiphilus TaxID=2631174 RepID=UPI0007C2AF0B|nr:MULTISPECIES: substrate-binding domain-containing protein [unclassified Oleiphilus]KZY47772.1 phosphate-binding protein [Oleiphilus sp. HI0050]KZZ32443.1 phosphate-binding protein [Oleiphilus sp. HI0086]KZZ38509.1 phosphate-binding protein [Oleiphilus sp. HI0117]KZZ58964.1 phosphate-binding protein [Oleiphilus sp. HI0123]